MRKERLWITQHSGLEAKLGLKPKTPALECEEKEMMGLREKESREGRRGETGSCRDRARDTGTGLKRGGKGLPRLALQRALFGDTEGLLGLITYAINRKQTKFTKCFRFFPLPGKWQDCTSYCCQWHD